MKINTNTKKLAFLLVLTVFMGFSGVAYGASGDTRYLVKSHSNFWKKSFSVRYEFKDGFTSDLTDWQLRLAKIFGVEVIPVKKLNILPESNNVVSDEAGADILKNRSVIVPRTRPVPSENIPWGVKYVYNDLLLEKTSGGVDINVAVLDTGALISHPDLKNNIEQCKDFTLLKAPVADGKCEDKNGHGTHVAGIISANGGEDGKGIYGVAPEARLFVYKVCGNNGSCWADDIAIAIRTAADNKANIINLSLGSDSESTLISDAIDYALSKNVLIFAAAGNDGPDEKSIDYPGANVNVVAVGAFDSNYDVAGWSSRGINLSTKLGVIEEGDLEFAAPGAIVESTWKDGGYVILSGTSMATPHMAGLAAKLWQKDADDPDSATRDILRTFAKDLGEVGEDNLSGYGFPHLK